MEYAQQISTITKEFNQRDTNEMFRLLESNQADAMLTLDNHTYHPSYVIAKEERVPAHFVTSSKSVFYNKKDLSINDIINEPFILTEKGFGYRRAFDDNLAKMSLSIEPVLEIGRTDIITNVLEQGIGISFLPDFVTIKKVFEGKLCYLDIIDFPYDVWKQLIHHKNKWISKPLKTFLNYIIEKEFDS